METQLLSCMFVNGMFLREPTTSTAERPQAVEIEAMWGHRVALSSTLKGRDHGGEGGRGRGEGEGEGEGMGRWKGVMTVSE